jgi:hypothetical protein
MAGICDLAPVHSRSFFRTKIGLGLEKVKEAKDAQNNVRPETVPIIQLQG